MNKLIIILFIIMTPYLLLATQTLYAKKIVIGTFDSLEKLYIAKETLSNNTLLQNLHQESYFLKTIRIKDNRRVLVIKKLSDDELTNDAFSLIKKDFPEAYLTDNSQLTPIPITIEKPKTVPQISQQVIIEEESIVEKEQITLNENTDSEIYDDEIWIDAEVLAIQNALESNQEFNDETAAGTEPRASAEQERIDEKYKRKTPKEEPLTELYLLLFTLIAISISVIFLLKRKKHRKVNIDTILDQDVNHSTS